MKYRVNALVTVSISTVVEAANEYEALDVATERAMPRLCHQCSGGDAEESWTTSGEFDGEAFDLEAEPEGPAHGR
jgi:hypothetical protein